MVTKKLEKTQYIEEKKFLKQGLVIEEGLCYTIVFDGEKRN